MDVDDHADGRVDARQLFDGEGGVEEGAAGAAVDLGHLDAHDAQVEERPQQVAIERLLLVHGPRERGDPVHREVADAVAEEPLVVGERRKGRGRSRGCVDRLGHGLRGIMAEACSNARGEVHVLRFAARASPDRRTHRRVGDADPRAVGRRPGPGTAGPAARRPRRHRPPAPGQTPPAQTPPAPGAPAGRSRRTPAPQPPAFRTGINFVRVDALVTDNKGNAVENLTQDDFEVYEDNKLQKVESFRYIKVEGNPLEGELPRQIRTTWDEETELARDDVRLFVIFYDDYHVRRGSALAVKRQLTEFIRKNVGPMDILGVMYPLTPFSTIGYTRNHEAVIKEIEAWDGRRFDYRPMNEFEERYAYYPTEVVERVRNQVSLSALEALVTGLGTKREGRKSVILISEGYSNYLPPQLRDPSAALPGVGNPNRNRPAGRRAHPRRAQRRTAGAVLLLHRPAQRPARGVHRRQPRQLRDLRARSARPGRLRVRHRPGRRPAARQGRPRRRPRHPAHARRRDRRARHPEQQRPGQGAGADGQGRQLVLPARLHRVVADRRQVQADPRAVKRPGLQVRARKGYWALSTDDVAAVTAAATRVGPAPEIGDALAQIETPLRARTIRTWIGTARGENGRTAVTLVWEPAPATTGERREPPAQLAVTAGGQSGAAYFRGKVPARPRPRPRRGHRPRLARARAPRPAGA